MSTCVGAARRPPCRRTTDLGFAAGFGRRDDQDRARPEDTELRDAATQMKQEIKSSADVPGKSLADFAVEIASA